MDRVSFTLRHRFIEAMDRDMEKIEEKLVKTLETLKLNLEHNTGSNAAGGGGSTKTTERPLLPLRIL